MTQSRIMQTGNDKPEELTIGQKVKLCEDVKSVDGRVFPKGLVGVTSHFCPSTVRVEYPDGLALTVQSEKVIPYVPKAGRPKGAVTQFKVGTLVRLNSTPKHSLRWWAEEGAVGIVVVKHANPMVYVLTGDSIGDRCWWFDRRQLTKLATRKDGSIRKACDAIRAEITRQETARDDFKQKLQEFIKEL